MFLFIGRDGSQYQAIVYRTRWGDMVRFSSMDGYSMRRLPIMLDVARRFGRFVRLVPVDGTKLKRSNYYAGLGLCID